MVSKDYHITSKSYQAADIFALRDEKLFSAMCTWINYCLHHLLSSERDTRHNLSLLGIEDILIGWFVIILALLHRVPKKGSHQTLGSNFVKS